MKKKIVSVGVTVALAAVAFGGATLAYFTDADEKTNVFTVGNVKIDLVEEFAANTDTDGDGELDAAILAPGTKTQNAIDKNTWIENIGANDSWVRMKIYIPANLDLLTTYPDNYEVTAIDNILHWNIASEAVTPWNVEKACWEAKVVNVDGEDYNEYIFYYNEILPAGEKTVQLLDQVYLDSRVDFDGKSYTFKGQQISLDNLNVIVVAEAIQADGFNTYESAFAAFDDQQ